jgi:hypothetical protein
MDYQVHSVITFLDKYTNVPIHIVPYIESNLPWDGISLVGGQLLINHRVSIGSILHEAGHIILTPYDHRKYLTGWIYDRYGIPSIGGDVAATFWGYLVCNYLDIPSLHMFNEGFDLNKDLKDLLMACRQGVSSMTSDSYPRDELMKTGLLDKQGVVTWDPSLGSKTQIINT